MERGPRCAAAIARPSPKRAQRSPPRSPLPPLDLQVLAGTCIVSAPLLASLRDAAETAARAAAQAALQDRRAAAAQVAAPSGGGAGPPASSKKKGAAKVRARALALLPAGSCGRAAACAGRRRLPGWLCSSA